MYHDKELLGQIGDASMRQIDSYVAEAEIAFGIALKRGAKGEAQCLPLDGITSFLGIALRDDICTSGVYPKGRIVSVMTCISSSPSGLYSMTGCLETNLLSPKVRF